METNYKKKLQDLKGWATTEKHKAEQEYHKHSEEAEKAEEESNNERYEYAISDMGQDVDRIHVMDQVLTRLERTETSWGSSVYENQKVIVHVSCGYLDTCPSYDILWSNGGPMEYNLDAVGPDGLEYLFGDKPKELGTFMWSGSISYKQGGYGEDDDWTFEGEWKKL